MKFHDREVPLSAAKPVTKLVRPRAKGQVTLPIEFRRRLNINEKTILSLSLKGSKIEILPLRALPEQASMREYTIDEIKRFLMEDRLDPRTAEKVRRFLGRRA